MPEAVKQRIDRLQGGITQLGKIRSLVVIVYEDDLIGLESRVAELEAELEEAKKLEKINRLLEEKCDAFKVKYEALERAVEYNKRRR